MAAGIHTIQSFRQFSAELDHLAEKCQEVLDEWEKSPTKDQRLRIDGENARVTGRTAIGKFIDYTRHAIQTAEDKLHLNGIGDEEGPETSPETSPRPGKPPKK